MTHSPTAPLSATLLLTLLSTVVFIACLSTFIFDYYKKADDTISEAHRQSKVLTHELDQMFKLAQSLIDNELATLEARPDQVISWLKKLESAIASEPNLSILTFGVAFEPYAYSKDKRLFAPMFERQSNDPNSRRYQMVALEQLIDYTKPYNPEDENSYNSSWYQAGLMDGTSDTIGKTSGRWHPPYYGEILKTLLSEYSRPFYGIHPISGQREKLGVVYLDLSLKDVRQAVQALEFQAGAYGTLLTNQGYIVSHPIRDWLGQPLLQTFGKKNEATAKTILQNVANGDSFVVEFKDPRSAQTYIALHQIIPTNSWSFAFTLPKSSLYKVSLTHRLLIISAFIALGLALIGAIRLLTRTFLIQESTGWKLSYFGFFWCVLLSTLTLWLFYNTNDQERYLRLLNSTDLPLPSDVAGTELTNSELHRLPTGIFLKEIKFVGADEANLSGLIWQRAITGTPEHHLGIDFVNGRINQTELKKIFTKSTPEGIIYGWRFATTVRQNSQISRYPFDKRTVRLQLAPAQSLSADDANQNTILVPDFSAYNLMAPSALPGIDPDLSLKYWAITESFFSHDSESKNHFSQLTENDNDSPLLIFNVKLNRKSVSPIVAYVLPIFIGSIMIFIVLMIPNDRSTGLVFSTLGYGGTIYFVISIFHVGLRNSEQIDGLSYLESYYIIMHAMIMLVSLNGFLQMINRGPAWIFNKNNMVPKMLYWPIIGASLFVMTLIYFLLPTI